MIKIDVLTYATHYDYDVYERFIGSLNDTGFSGKIYIIVHASDVSNIDLLKIKYNNIFLLLDDLEKNPLMHVNNHRFFVMQKYLDALEFESDYILSCDFRDVLFQKNIENYDYDNNTDLYGFLESIKMKQDVNCNTPWMKSLEVIFDESFYDTIANEYVICCGTTIGTIKAIRYYVDMMCNYILKYNIHPNLDQGIHNYMFYCNKLSAINVKLLSNEDNLVNTVGCAPKLLDENDNIVNSNNDISYIVHQYDRYPIELKQKISKKLGYNFEKH